MFFTSTAIVVAQETEEQEIDSVKTGFDLG